MDDPPTISTRRRIIAWLPLLSVLVVAILVRGGVLLLMPRGLSKDTDGYRLLAETLLQRGQYALPRTHCLDWHSMGDESGELPRPPAEPAGLEPTAFRPPLYPLLLGRVAGSHEVAAWRIGLLHVLLGLATTWLTFHLGGLWGLGRHRVTAALLVACDPILLNQSAQIMTETLAAFLAVAGLYATTRMTNSRTPFHVALAGGAAGLAVLCRPTFLVWLAAAAAVAWFVGTDWKRRLTNGMAFMAGSCVVLVPWMVRNHFAVGRPIVTTTHGGYTLYLGNNESYYQHINSRIRDTVWNSEEFGIELQVDFALYRLFDTTEEAPPRNREPIYDRYCYERAYKCMRSNPTACGAACLRRIGRLWGILPYQTDPNESRNRRWMRYAVAVWYAGVFLLAAIGCYAVGRRLWRSPWLWGTLLCLSFTAVHTFYWTDLRMRAPLMPVVALVAAAGLAWVLERKSRRKALSASGLGSKEGERRAGYRP